MSTQKGIPYVASIKTTSAVAADAQSAAIEFPVDLHSGVFLLNITAASGTSPTLDLNIEITPDDGTTWFTAFRFAQQTAASKARVIAVFHGHATNTAVVVTNPNAGNAVALALTGGALSAGCPISRKIRANYDIGGTNPSFTFTLDFIGRSLPHAEAY